MVSSWMVGDLTMCLTSIMATSAGRRMGHLLRFRRFHDWSRRDREILGQQMRWVTIHRSGPGTGSNGASSGGGDTDLEQHLASLQRSVQEIYRRGEYDEALTLAQHALVEFSDYFGKDHPVVASMHNNIALMMKMLGDYDGAIEAYLTAISTYRSAVGERHPQYAASLTNLGLCFQAAALHNHLRKGGSLDRIVLLERAVETLEEAYRLKTEAEVTYSDSVVTDHSSQVRLARMHFLMAQFHLNRAGGSGHSAKDGKNMTQASSSEVEAILREHIDELASTKKGKGTPELGTAMNNLAFILKTEGRIEEARPVYEEALTVRKAVLGERHVDTIASMHNLAELFLAMGKEDLAADIQNQILELLDPAKEVKDYLQ